MEFQAWHLIVLVVVAIIGTFGQNKWLGFFVKSKVEEAVKPLSDELIKEHKENSEEHKEIFEKFAEVIQVVSVNKATLNRFNDNKAFYSSIDETIQDAISLLNIDNPEPDASQYIDKFGSSIISFFREVYQTGIDVVSDDVVKTKSQRYIREIRTLGIELFGKEFTASYFKKYRTISPNYIKAICLISESNGNSKEKRFRTATMKYAEDVGNAFSNFFLTNKELIS